MQFNHGGVSFLVLQQSAMAFSNFSWINLLKKYDLFDLLDYF
jgi:hypothetical protein